MSKNKGKLDISRMPLWGHMCNLCKQYCKYIILATIILLIVCIGVLAVNIVTLRSENNLHINEKVRLIEYNQILEKEQQLLQNNVIQLESEIQTCNDKLKEYEETLKKYEKSNQANSTNWGSMKSYMSYKAITNTSSKQYRLQKQATTDPSTGIRMIDGKYCIAIGSGWGYSVGESVLVTLQGDKNFNAIISDMKADIHTNADNKTTTHDGSVVEFVVDIPVLPKKVRTSGNVGTLEQFSGGVVSITKG